MPSLLFLLPIFLLFTAITTYIFIPNNSFSWILVAVINLIYLHRFFRCVPIFIMFSFFLLYTFELYNFFISGYRISYWLDFQSASYLNKVIIMNGIFLCTLGSTLYNVTRDNIINTALLQKPDQFIFTLSTCLFFVCAHFGLSGSTILTSAYAAGGSSKSPLFEYSVVFFVIALFSTRESKIQKSFIWMMFIFFSVKGFLYGGRIEVIPMALALFYFKTNFFRSWSLKKLYISMIVAFLLFSIIGRIRTNPLIIFDIVNNPLVLFQFSQLASSGIVSSNYGDVLQASARMTGLVDTGIWELEFRIKSLFSYVFNVFLFGSELKDISNLALKDQDTYGAGGGGLISSQFYVWLGWIGPILVATFLGCIIKKGLQFGVSKPLSMYVFMLLITFPRWYAYVPLALVKMCLITSVLYYLSHLVSGVYIKK
jgi:hypothetical protein